MNKIGMIAATLIGAIVLGLGVYNSDASGTDPKLSEDDIRNMVSTQYPGEITALELEKELGSMVYGVQVAGESKQYDMELDGDTGEVLVIREKEMTQTDDGQNTVNMEARDEIEQNDNKVEERDEDKQQDGANTEERNKDVANTANKNNDILTIVQIEDIALNEFAGLVKEIELEREDGRLVYEVEIKNENQEEAELDIDAYSGEILKIEKEFKARGNSEHSKQLPEDLLSIADIKEIALNEFSGQIKELELEREDGRLIYEVEVKSHGREAEMEIDAHTGDILELEID